SCIELCKSKKSLYSGLRWEEPGIFGPLVVMIAAYERDHEIFSRQLRSLDDGAWNHQAWLIEGTEEILLKDTVGGLLWIALFDSVHHRGQLSAYIRPVGATVPSIYGPSADDAGEQHYPRAGAYMTDAHQDLRSTPRKSGVGDVVVRGSAAGF